MLEHWRIEEILEEAKVEPIAMVTRRMEWFGRVKMSLQDPLPRTGRRRKVRKFY